MPGGRWGPMRALIFAMAETYMNALEEVAKEAVETVTC